MVSESLALFKPVLAKIKPTSAQKAEFLRISSEFISLLQKCAGSQAHVILGGSGAKDTWLAMSHDADVFVVFDRGMYASKSLELSDIVQGWMKKAFKSLVVERIHGSRDYFGVMFEGIRFEVVPIIGISDATEALNITDISPLHSIWVGKKGRALVDDIRLAKQFCRAQGVYGAESHIRGFSGYILEILIVHYGSFEKFMLAAAKWKMPVICDVEGYYPKKTVFFELNKSKLQSPLIVIDPVDKSRNASAALSDEKFFSFIASAKKWVKSHDLSMFETVPLSVEVLRKAHKKSSKNGVMLAIEVRLFEGKDDIVGVKVLKAQEHIERALIHFGVHEKGCVFEGKRAIMWFMLNAAELPEYFEQVGPPVDKIKFVEEFKKEHPHFVIRDGVLFARVNHAVRGLEPFVMNVLSEKYVTDRISLVEKIHILK